MNAEEEYSLRVRVWYEFRRYWDDTDWDNVDRNQVINILSPVIPNIEIEIPKNLSEPEIGNEFALELKSALKIGIRQFSLIEKSLFEMYKEYNIGSIKNPHCRMCKDFCINRGIIQNLAGPISAFHIGKNFPSDKYKIAFVGKNTWYGIDSYRMDKRKDSEICDARDFGLHSLQHLTLKRSPFIDMITDFNETLYGKSNSFDEIAVTNLIKCNTKGEDDISDDKTDQYIIKKCLKCGVFEKEIAVLHPKRVIFFTGPDYDDYIKNLDFGYSVLHEEDEIVNDNIRKSNRIISWKKHLYNEESGEFLFILRISHPQAKDKQKMRQHMFQWIVETCVIERLNSK